MNSRDRVPVMVVLFLFVLATGMLIRRCAGQTPNLLVQVDLVGVGSTMVEAVLTPDSVLLLPARDVAALLGLDPPPGEWTSIADLQHRFPPLAVIWAPRELRLVIRDDLAVLPATRRLTEQQRRQAQGAPSYFATRSGRL